MTHLGCFKNKFSPWVLLPSPSCLGNLIPQRRRKLGVSFLGPSASAFSDAGLMPAY